MTQTELSSKAPVPITFHVYGKRGNGTLTYAVKQEQYVILETGNPGEPLYLDQNDLQYITEGESELILDLPEETAGGGGRREGNPKTS